MRFLFQPLISWKYIFSDITRCKRKIYISGKGKYGFVIFPPFFTGGREDFKKNVFQSAKRDKLLISKIADVNCNECLPVLPERRKQWKLYIKLFKKGKLMGQASPLGARSSHQRYCNSSSNYPRVNIAYLVCFKWEL